MPVYNVLTESGADYIIDMEDGFWQYRGRGIERIWTFKVADREHMLELDTEDELWEYLRGLPQADEPVIGKAVFLVSGDAWRLSTNVVAIRVVDKGLVGEDDDD